MSWWTRQKIGELAPGDEPAGGELPRVPRFDDPARPGEPTDVCTRHMSGNTPANGSVCGVCGHHCLVHPGYAGGTLTACAVCQMQDLARPDRAS